MIGQFCTSDVENYGDLLYPVLLPKILEKHGRTSDLITLGFIEGPAPCKAGYKVYDINDVLLRENLSLEKLYIGGGDIIRTDRRRLASHYEKRYKDVLNNKFEQFIRKLMRRDELGRFSSKFMGYESPGPFIVNNNNYKKISNIIYCSCGVPFDIDESESESVRDAFETARFIYLRDYKSKEKLIKSGVKCEINVAPDLIVKLSDFFDKEDAKRKGQSILKKQNVNTAKKILCFQSKPNNKKDTELIFNELLTYKKKNDAEIILMPIGFCHGDDVYLKTLSDRSDGAFHYIDVHSIFDMISVIGSSDFFVGTSMHGNITAFSFCIPHLFGDISVEKIDGFLEVTGLSSSYKLNNWSMLNQGISIVEQINNGNFQNTVNIAKRKVDDIFSLMCSK